MSQRLDRLRMNLDFMPSPMEDRPGLLVRDGYHYSPATLIIPPLLVACLDLFDGEHTMRDVKDRIYELTNDFSASKIAEQLERALNEAGFLENETYHQVREEAHRI